ncbi:MAG: metal-dependent hydrolase [Novosphingobium sp.]|nr:MAG: metal-dependent hydrolase [Novosphingobium sp.]
MDNVTHSLVGALLGQMGLKRKTGLAMPTLIIAANIPDIDAGCTVLGTVSLAMRRGITHGPIAMLLLPLALTAVMVWYDRRQTRRGTRPADRLPLRPGWLLALAYIGCLSHPLFDWMNSYGVRLLEPFSHRWFYGDALFIVDPWLLAMLIVGVWFSRKRDKAARGDWRRPARTAFAGIVAYLALNLGISTQAAAQARDLVPGARMVVANPTPVTFWRREVLVRTDSTYRSYDSVPFQALKAVSPIRPIGMEDPRIALRVVHNPEAQAFLFWSRMPLAEVQGDTIVLGDQRFSGIAAGNFRVELKP